MGISVGSRPNNVTSIINSFNNPPPKPKPEAEKSCQVKNNWAKSADDSIHIFTKTWQPIGVSVHSVVVFVHDIVEHCERYQPLFVLFAGKGIEVQSFDLPGFGETGARADALGITGGYEALVKEIDHALDRALTTRPSKPIFLMGHGMGGALVLNYVCGLGQRITSLAGIMVSSPYLKPTISGAGTRFPSTYNRLVGDMIYQGQKLLRKRWKQFPPALPILLLHGTEDPICSYQATSTLSTLLQKLEPTNLKFKSWKGNKHDPHWDLDADAVRSEYIHWIRNISRNYVKPPLEPAETVPTDTLQSAKSTGSLALRGKRTATTADQHNNTSPPTTTKGKTNVKDQPPSADDPYQPPTVPTTPSGAAAAEPEAIQDLAGLRRQQELKLQRALEKRQEYNLLSDGDSTAADDNKAAAGDTAAVNVSSSEATSNAEPQASLYPAAAPDAGAKTEATEQISNEAVPALASEAGGDTATGVIHLTTAAAAADRSASAPNLAETTIGDSIHLPTPPRADHSASAPNLADTAESATIHLTPPSTTAAAHSASAPNLADITPDASIHLTTPPRSDRSASAPNLADTSVGTAIDTVDAEIAPANQAAAFLSDSGSTIAAVTDGGTCDPSVAPATEEARINDDTDNDAGTQETTDRGPEHHSEREEPSISDLTAAVHAALATTTTASTAVTPIAVTTTHSTTTENTDLRDSQA
ncbi:hypothetical protein BGZ70_007592 [Mortierella alpina]|uniref:Serine aminopeptidase S33 domain-containing protein n=1 Tax=Mortierella alpina TaxID=64518 RepID=A0A9P6M2J0_MORAP|nr:hypothetical protein BGZ70_007592 [Mortierella alpina]